MSLSKTPILCLVVVQPRKTQGNHPDMTKKLWTRTQTSTKRTTSKSIFFLFLNENICCGCTGSISLFGLILYVSVNIKMILMCTTTKILIEN